MEKGKRLAERGAVGGGLSKVSVLRAVGLPWVFPVGGPRAGGPTPAE